MTAIWQQRMTGRVLDLRAGVRLRLTGPDAERYLNGQVTNDVRKLTPAAAMPACVTNHKGKLEAMVWLRLAADGELFVSGDPGVADFLPLRLGRYLIADDAELEDVSTGTALLHFPGASPETVPGESGDAVVACERLGGPGLDLWTTPGRAQAILDSGAFALLTPEEAAAEQVLAGVPAWGRELGPDVLPAEAGLDVTAVDFSKGCYIGQEVISRMRSAGKVNRHLTAWQQTDGPPLQAGWLIFSGTGQEAGALTGVATDPQTGRRCALGWRKRTAEPPFRAGPDENSLFAALEIRNTLDE